MGVAGYSSTRAAEKGTLMYGLQLNDEFQTFIQKSNILSEICRVFFRISSIQVRLP